MFELNEASTDTPSPEDAAIVVRSRLDVEPAEVRRFLTGLCHYVFSVTTSDREKFVVRIATPSTKRLLAGGVVDVDQLCFGDPLLTLGLTKMALHANANDVDYVEHWMNLLGLDKQLRQVVDAYTLLFCVDFMSELGQRFNKEDRPEIDVQKFTRLESVFETLAH
jgi:hypothetical protein